MEERRIHYYDSLGYTNYGYLQGLLHYIMCESVEKKNWEILNLIRSFQWTLVPSTGNTPRQDNGCDCGVFVCMSCYFILSDRG